MKSIQQKAIEFIYVVKQRFINQPSKFNEFARVISSLKLEKDHSHLISELKSFFANDHPDLLLSLNQFLSRKYGDNDDDNDDNDDDMVEEDHSPPKKKQCKGLHAWLLRESPSELFNKVRDRCIEKNDDEFRVLMKFAETVLWYHEKKISSYQVDVIIKDLFKNDLDLYVEFTRVLAQSLEKSGDEKSGLLKKGGKERGDAYCSLYEETMDVKEFYLFEMDMVFSRLESTIKKLEEDPERLEECFTVLDVKCIEKLYNDSDDDHNGGCGEEMVEILKSNPVGRVVVLERLRQKRMQLEEQKVNLDKIWDEIFQDIREKGRVCRHREFLRRTEKASTNGFKTKQ